MENRSPEHDSDRTTTAMPRRGALRWLGASGLVAGLLPRFGAHEASGQSALTTAATEAATRRAVNAINQALASGDMTVLDFAFASTYVNHTPRRSPRTGQLFSPDLAGLEASLTALRAVAPDAVLVVEDVVSSGDTAAIRATFRGTVDPAVVALPAGTTSRLSIGGAAFARVVDGRVVESWDYDEAAEVLGQLALPAPTPTPTPAPEPTAPPADAGEAREVRDFQELALSGIGTLLLRQGDTESLTIEAESRVLRRISAEVRNGRLTIQPDRSIRTDEPVTYRLSARQLSAIDIAGAARVEAGDFIADQLRVTLKGSTALAIANLTANSLTVDAAGNAQVALAGAVDAQSVSVAGSSVYDAGNLASREASVTTQAAAQATVRVSERLSATAAGASRIMYLGNPEVQEDTSAAASVTNVGQ